MQKYLCECGWTGTEDEMEADSIAGNEYVDEVWSNWICPSCKMWWDLEDYKKVSAGVGK